jgi:hypothetical protein
MKNLKTFSEFLKESDVLADLGLDDAGKDDKTADKKEDKKEVKKEDPIAKLQKDAKKKEDRKEEKFDEYMDKRMQKLKDIFDKYPELEKEIGKKVMDAVKSEDRVALHNATNELIYLQVNYEKAGDIDAVHQITAIKTIVDDLDHSYTNNKQI